MAFNSCGLCLPTKHNAPGKHCYTCACSLNTQVASSHPMCSCNSVRSALKLDASVSSSSEASRPHDTMCLVHWDALPRASSANFSTICNQHQVIDRLIHYVIRLPKAAHTPQTQHLVSLDCLVLSLRAHSQCTRPSTSLQTHPPNATALTSLL